MPALNVVNECLFLYLSLLLNSIKWYINFWKAGVEYVYGNNSDVNVI